MTKYLASIFMIMFGIVLIVAILTELPAPTPVEDAKMKEMAQQMESLHRGDLIEYSDGAIVRVCYTARGAISLQRVIDISCISYPIRDTTREIVKIHRYSDIGWIKAAGKYLGAVNATFNVCCLREENIKLPKPTDPDFTPG